MLCRIAILPFFIFVFCSSGWCQSAEESDSLKGETHRILVIGGLQQTQKVEPPKFQSFLNAIGSFVSVSLRDSLRKKKIYVASYLPESKIDQTDYESNFAVAVHRCKCTLLLQTKLLIHEGTMVFEFDAIDLKVDANSVALVSSKWKMTKSYQSDFSSVVPSDIVNEAVADLLSKKILLR